MIFEAILSPRAPGAPFWAPFMYVEICRRVSFFTLKQKIEVLDDISPCRSRKPGFFKFSSRSPAILQFWELRFELRSLKNATIVKFRKKWKYYVFIISAKSASVLTYGRLQWNGIRFLSIGWYKILSRSHIFFCFFLSLTVGVELLPPPRSLKDGGD